MGSGNRNSRGGIKKTGKNTKSSSVGSSSTQVGLNQSQVNQLKNSSWADKSALASYEKSGSVVGGRNNPNGKGRENVAAIPADGLSPQAPMNLPTLPAPTDPGSVLAPTNIGLESTAEGMYTVDPATGMMTMAPATDVLAQNQQGRLDEMFKAYAGMGSGEADLAKLEKENKLAQKRQAVASLTGNLNSIVASSQAEQLKLEGQGRGQTTGFIGGEQARINREAAIAALPVQAQLAAAQGDLAMAEAHVDKLFQIKRQDAQALFNFKAQVINSVYDFADKQEQRRLDEVNKIETRKYQEQQDFLKTQRALLSSALQQGAPQSVIDGINSAGSLLDAISAAGAYNGDVLARQIQQAQLRKLNTPEVTTTSMKAPEVKNINGEDRQWNPETGKWDVIGGGDTSKKQQMVTAAQDKLSALQGIKNHAGLNTAVGPNAFMRMALTDSFGAKQDFIGSVENILSTETLDTLINLKAKGGTLGALSDQELKMLQESASKVGTWRKRDEAGNVVGYNVDEARFKAEIGRLETLTQRAITNALGYDPNLLGEQESTIIDAYLGTGSSAFNPASFY